MRYYLSLFGLFVFLSVLDLFVSRLFMRANISFVLAFLLTSAFVIPQKTRFIYRTMIPLMLVCGLAGDSVSAVSPGVIFICYCLLAVIVVSISKNIPSADSVGYLVAVVFGVAILFRVVFGILFNGLSPAVFVSILLPAFLSAIYTAILAFVFAYLLETPFGHGFGKIIFNSDS